MDLLIKGGPFAYTVILLGLVALALGVLQLIKRDRNYTGLTVSVIAAMAFVAVVGWQAGLYQAYEAISVATREVENMMLLWAGANAIAGIPLQLAGVLGFFASLLCGIGHVRRERV